MKKIIIAIFCVLAAVACEKPAPEAPQPVQLRVSLTNIAGEWDLMQWKGNAVESGSVVVKLSKDKTFVLTQTVGSMYPAEYTGEYNLVEEAEGTVIRGIYDYTYEYWDHQYKITSLTEEEMEWTSTDDAEDIYVYSKID